MITKIAKMISSELLLVAETIEIAKLTGLRDSELLGIDKRILSWEKRASGFASVMIEDVSDIPQTDQELINAGLEPLPGDDFLALPWIDRNGVTSLQNIGVRTYGQLVDYSWSDFENAGIFMDEYMFDELHDELLRLTSGDEEC